MRRPARRQGLACQPLLTDACAAHLSVQRPDGVTAVTAVAQAREPWPAGEDGVVAELLELLTCTP